MYKYPLENLDYFSELLTVKPEEHSMGCSLVRYMDIKIHPLLIRNKYNKIVVRGLFDRSIGISSKEKDNKMFNYMRPTAMINSGVIYINCFPGIDYVFHYGNIIQSYIKMKGMDIKVQHIIPSEEECWQAISNSELKNIPKCHTVIMGYVEGIQNISSDTSWQGNGYFLWKKVLLSSGDAILLGCKHTYWGEIAGRIVTFLSINGVKRIIYAGKLGAASPDLIPNQSIATGNVSILPNGNYIYWKNLFEGVKDFRVRHGTHITVPSVLQETKEWLAVNINRFDYVDPEIGHMASAAANCGMEFSYFHIISDNLSAKYASDLSNERNSDVLSDRKRLCKIIGRAILDL